VNPSLTIAAHALRVADAIETCRVRSGGRGMTGTALITGGQQGIGLGIAQALHGAGWRIALMSERGGDDPAVIEALALLPGAVHVTHDMPTRVVSRRRWTPSLGRSTRWSPTPVSRPWCAATCWR
jgi:hypothetical protein